MKPGKWLTIFFSILLCITLPLVVAVVVIDPYFHFHGPQKGFQYPLNDPRYVNNGIARHYDYEVMITGTSMSDNFTTSSLEDALSCKAIKTTFSGATYHELSENMERAISYQPNLKMIICSLDPNNIAKEADAYTYEGCPEYLYDDIWWNDVKYLLNKDVLVQTLAVINYTRAGNKTPSFDMYERFDLYSTYGTEAVLASYTRLEKKDLCVAFTDEDRKRIYENVYENYVTLAKNNPDVRFNFFIPPYSMCYWDGMERSGQMDYCMEAMKYGIGVLLTQDNIHIYGFDDLYEVTTNLDRYMDTIHYDAKVNAYILDCICNGERELVAENLNSYFEQLTEFYDNFEFPY